MSTVTIVHYKTSDHLHIRDDSTKTNLNYDLTTHSFEISEGTFRVWAKPQHREPGQQVVNELVYLATNFTYAQMV